jgi:hypothetical protein
VLDLWLMVVMCVWIFDIALSAVLNAGRFDLGFYAGRVHGLLAATFVLGVLLVENVMLYARLAGVRLTLGRQARALEETVRERTQRGGSRRGMRRPSESSAFERRRRSSNRSCSSFRPIDGARRTTC